MLYRKKPVTVEAMLFSPSNDNLLTWLEEGGSRFLAGDARRPELLLDPDTYEYPESGHYIRPSDGALMIRTLEGDMAAKPGDYIIRGIAGEFYPCRGDIFIATYEPVVRP